jgi:hypothetical protein
MSGRRGPCARRVVRCGGGPGGAQYKIVTAWERPSQQGCGAPQHGQREHAGGTVDRVEL